LPMQSLPQRVEDSEVSLLSSKRNFQTSNCKSRED